MKKLERFGFYAIPLIVLAIIASFFMDIKAVIIVLFSSLLLISYVIYKEKIGQELVVAFLIAIALTSYHYYQYTTVNLMFGKLNIFPLISFTFGLVLLRELYERLKNKHKLVIATLIYLFVLFSVEYIGYNFLGIKLDSSYPSLLGLGFMHAPTFLKTFYLTIGPIYLVITDYLKVK